MSRKLKATFLGLTVFVAAAALAVIQTRDRVNPLPASPEAVARGARHFAERCAACHAADGSGERTILSSTVPDLRKSATQSLSDGELYFILENSGVRGSDDIWRIVHFLRTLPNEASRQALAPARRDGLGS